jgi:predicted metal-dependent hydrolase
VKFDHVHIKRTARKKTISIQIKDESIKVLAPYRASDAEIQAVLKKHAAWINEKLAIQKSQPKPQTQRFEAGATVQFLGKPVTLRVDPAVVYPEMKSTTLFLPQEQDMRGQTLSWLWEQADQHLPQRVITYAPKVGKKPTSVIIKDFKAQWGNCNTKGVIRLNWRLIMAPPTVVDYVVVHELCHLHEMNHSTRFWAQVARIIPEHRQRRAWLREQGRALYLL